MSDSLTAEQLMARAVAEATRVLREGGTGVVHLPDSETGLVTPRQLDQEHARELLAWLIDSYVAQVWAAIRDGAPLSAGDRKVLADWTAATVTEAEDAERERRQTSAKRRGELYVIRGDKP